MKDPIDLNILLREVQDDDLPIFFDQLRDPEACHMAAFTVRNPSDHNAFQEHWAKIRGDEEITVKTILFEGSVAGHVAIFGPAGEKEVTYWIGKEFWGKGIATAALSRFLGDLPTRPIYARAAVDNVASLRVLEICGFEVSGSGRFFANGRGVEVDEVILELPVRVL